MKFCIQVSNPKYKKESKELGDITLSDAVESTFPMETENAYMEWNHICIPLSYKYDIGYMLDDAILLIWDMMKKTKGKKIIHWLPDTFRTDWNVTWENGNLRVVALWECTVGHLEELLNRKNCIELTVSDFLCEWKKLFSVIIESLEINGYERNELTNFDKMVKIEDNIREYGVRYRV